MTIDDFFDAGFTWLSISIVLSGREAYRRFFGVVEMWQGDRLRQLRRDWLLRNRVPDTCRTCTYYMH